MCLFDCCFEKDENEDKFYEIDEQLEMIRRYATFKLNKMMKEKEEEKLNKNKDKEYRNLFIQENK